MCFAAILGSVGPNERQRSSVALGGTTSPFVDPWRLRTRPRRSGGAVEGKERPAFRPVRPDERQAKASNEGS
ncbi:hypothetical protein NL676_018975 [Syzygium grande]|nr:hypothetical protein NL676_018975 [Syzygium grande]